MRRLHIVRNPDTPEKWMIFQQVGNGKDGIWTEEKRIGKPGYDSRDEALAQADKMTADAVTFDADPWELAGYDTEQEWRTVEEVPVEEEE